MEIQNGLPTLDVEAKPAIDQSHAADLRLFEQVVGEMPFADIYASLNADGYSWRQSAVIAWLAMPKSERAPATKRELGDMLGCSGTTIAKLVKAEATQLQLVRLTTSSLLQHMASVNDALIQSASDPNYKNNQDRKTYYQLTGVLQDKHEIIVKPTDNVAMQQKSESELLAMAQAGDDDIVMSGEDE